MQHDHLKFYSHGSNSNNRTTSILKLGTGSSVVPTLSFNQANNQSYTSTKSHQRSGIEKHIEIVEYLKQLPISTKV